MDEENDDLTVLTEQGVEVYTKVPGGRYQGRHQYKKMAGDLREAPVGKSATVKAEVNGCLKVIDTGPPIVTAAEKLESSFLQHLRSYEGEWFWEDLHTPGDIE